MDTDGPNILLNKGIFAANILLKPYCTYLLKFTEYEFRTLSVNAGCVHEKVCMLKRVVNFQGLSKLVNANINRACWIGGDRNSVSITLDQAQI